MSTITVESEGRKIVLVGTFTLEAKVENDWEEIRTNPAMFAALAGARVEEWVQLPGETIDYILIDRKATLVIRGSFTSAELT